jgi:mRNA-degrading endonuclease RelE of RelBE toxin-antitoxin system
LWTFEYSSKFIKQYKNLSSHLQEKITTALTSLESNVNPLELGVYKANMKAFAYDIDKSHRILYNVRFSDGVIELIRVGDHKQVCGKD